MAQVIEVTLKKSLIGIPKPQRLAVKGLGLRKIGSSSTLNDTPHVRGLVSKVQHLVNVQVRKN